MHNASHTQRNHCKTEGKKKKMMRNDSNSSLNSTLDEDGSRQVTTTTTTVLKKGPWSAVEDAILIDYVQKHGEGNWNFVQKNCGLERCGKSCRLRWANHLRPNLKKGSFTPEEEMLILQLHAQFGNKWAHMAVQMPGRTDNEIKNYWNTRIKRRQRAGLPLYTTRMASVRPPPLMVPSTSSSPLQHSPILHLPLQLFKQPALSNPLMSESPRVKRSRDDGLTLQFPFGSPYMHQHQQQMGVAAATTRRSNMFQYNNNNNIYGNNGNFNEINMNFLMSTMGLPSTQLYNGGDGGCRLMDDLLQEQGGKLVFSDQPTIADENRSNGDEKDLFVDSFPKFEELKCSNGIGMKRTQSEQEEANPESTRDDISKLIDMISTPVMPPPPEWQTLTTTNSCEISNGGQSLVVTDSELGLELQHLASSLSPVDQEWNIGSCAWNNMPGIG